MQTVGPSLSQVVRRISGLCKLMFYCLCYGLAATVVGALFPVRITGGRKVPKQGPVLVIANHQSFLDPILVGLTLGRQSGYPARSNLFRFPLAKWALEALGGIPIERDGVAKEGIKRAADRLQNGGAVVIWPEGTRTQDGRIGTLKPGALLLARKSAAAIVVCGIAGAFESWPRSQRLPWPSPIWVHFELFDLQAADAAEQLQTLRSAMENAAAAAQNRLNAFRLSSVIHPARPQTDRCPRSVERISDSHPDSATPRRRSPAN